MENNGIDGSEAEQGKKELLKEGWLVGEGWKQLPLESRRKRRYLPFRTGSFIGNDKDNKGRQEDKRAAGDTQRQQNGERPPPVRERPVLRHTVDDLVFVLYFERPPPWIQTPLLCYSMTQVPSRAVPALSLALTSSSSLLLILFPLISTNTKHRVHSPFLHKRHCLARSLSSCDPFA